MPTGQSHTILANRSRTILVNRAARRRNCPRARVILRKFWAQARSEIALANTYGCAAGSRNPSGASRLHA